MPGEPNHSHSPWRACVPPSSRRRGRFDPRIAPRLLGCPWEYQDYTWFILGRFWNHNAWDILGCKKKSPIWDLYLWYVLVTYLGGVTNVSNDRTIWNEDHVLNPVLCTEWLIQVFEVWSVLLGISTPSLGSSASGTSPETLTLSESTLASWAAQVFLVRLHVQRVIRVVHEPPHIYHCA